MPDHINFQCLNLMVVQYICGGLYLSHYTCGLFCGCIICCNIICRIFSKYIAIHRCQVLILYRGFYDGRIDETIVLLSQYFWDRCVGERAIGNIEKSRIFDVFNTPKHQKMLIFRNYPDFLAVVL